jgi:predicted nucleic acid-binding protein
MALKQLIRQVAVVLLLIVSLDGTAYLGYDYLRSIFWVPEAQWQLAFMLAPLPIVLGDVAALISQFWHRVDDTMAPALWEAELADVIWMSVRGSVLTKEDAPEKLLLAGRLGIHSVSVRKLWQGALQRALESGVAAYDTVFVELAHREQLSLATFDNKLLKMYPDIAKRPKDLM